MIGNISLFDIILGPGLIKQQPEDFRVRELIRFEPEGTGDHLYLYVQKIGANTEWVLRQLAKIAGVASKDIGYAGLKDRHAITQQWFSVYSPHSEIDFSELPENISIVSQTRGQKKLKTAAVLANEFAIRVHYSDIDCEALDQRLTHIKAQGFPNYFGQQRFGHEGRNIENLLAMAKGKRCKPNQRSMYISAGRSHLFNLILNERVRNNTWNQWVPGDVAVLDKTRSIFPVEEISDELQQRLAAFDVHPALPLYGLGEWPSRATQRDLEEQVYAQNPALVNALKKLKVEVMPRASRAIPQQMSWHIDNNYVDISFTLGAGSYATTLLEQLFSIESTDSN